MKKTFAYFILNLKKDFTSFCNQKLQEIGMTQGLLYFIIYIGKHSGCSTGNLIQDLHMDWGYAQRSIEKLSNDGFVNKQRAANDKRIYHLSLTTQGEEAFSICHEVFSTWDETVLCDLSTTERENLFAILEKLSYQEREPVYVPRN